ncbi:alpha/beta hydrolase [Salinisphaera aquimarina]|uniref:Alpha/beta hydrolase n=1 Tax=Salinisphaera aquimarina TaxID=2094031 RepID=A0ABV7ELU5_9GAMM
MNNALLLVSARHAVLALLSLLVFAGPAVAASMRFKAADGAAVYATLSKAPQDTHAVALLFHQAGANRHEYDSIAPRLNTLGFDTLAVDQRAVGRKFGGDNETVARRGASGSYDEAYADLEGALDWAQAQGYDTIVAVGSSYSASLSLQLAAEHGDALSAVAVFSPGEYFDDTDRVKNAVADIDIPLYITTDPAEENRVDEVLERADSAAVVRYKPEDGVHGASTLDPDRDPAGHKANWQSFSAFMTRFVPGA